MDERFQDQGQTIYNFLDEILVQCPRCSACALIMKRDRNLELPLYKRISGPRRLVCQKCGHSSEWDGNSVRTGGNSDPYFQLPLWLQIPCCGEILWAYNHEHLDYLGKIVQAKLRERKPGHTRSVMSRLPGWMKSAKNRDEVLKGIAKLREKAL